jgi:hypothetical protein
MAVSPLCYPDRVCRPTLLAWVVPLGLPCWPSNGCGPTLFAWLTLSAYLVGLVLVVGLPCWPG